MIYWILNSLDILDCSLSQNIIDRAIFTLSRLQNETGGFGGGLGQISHLAGTYAAVNALAITRSEIAFNIINRSPHFI